MAAKLLFLFLAAALLVGTAVDAHNITAILADYPEYAEYNRYLTETKVADEINSRETVTCLVLSNGAMSALAAKRPLAAVKAALRLLTLLDYYDGKKLHDISDGSVLTTTLLQTTGAAAGNLGFVNITDLKGGKVGFGSTSPGSKLDSVYTKSVKQQPYSLSVLEISAPIVFPGLLDAPARASANLTALLEKAGCKTFAAFITSSGVLKIYQSAMDKGLTVFAPNDEAFKADGVPDLTTLSNAELVTLLQYHAVPGYLPKASLMASKGPITTLATSGAGKYDLTVKTRGDEVTLDTGLDTSRIASTVIDDTPFCILTVDSVLLPTALFGKAPAPAPGLVPTAAPSPAPAAEVPAPEKAKAPAPELASPPAPPMESPGGSPADSPDAKAADSKTEKAGANGKSIPIWGFVVVAAALGSILLSS
uniref:Fasciclin-like arabinogalactan protein 10 n=1 Tax=Anthurium amnicola TaxID=1678845 RepID=A0A1D1Y230_9ARAE